MRALICGAARMRAGSVLRREADKAAPHDGENRRPAPSPPAMATIFTGFSPLSRGVEPNTLSLNTIVYQETAVYNQL
uniref:Uncharacterized protein n=1 Tax=Oryza barthii TaxID=65489 RepID=A0A0D3EST8_9ORYZ